MRSLSTYLLKQVNIITKRFEFEGAISSYFEKFNMINCEV